MTLGILFVLVAIVLRPFQRLIGFTFTLLIAGVLAAWLTSGL